MQGFIKTIINAIQAWTKKEIKKNVNITLPTPDWNENDPNADGYIENRTHWEEIEEVTLIPEMSVSITDDDGYEELGKFPQLQIGQTYNVILNGIRYTCVARQHQDSNALIGNGTIYGDDDIGNNEPFSCDSYTDGSIYLNVANKGMYTISISIVKKMVIHKLDPKYLDLPNNIATTDEVQEAIKDAETQSNWDQEDEAAVDFIINKPFYVSYEPTEDMSYKGCAEVSNTNYIISNADSTVRALLFHLDKCYTNTNKFSSTGYQLSYAGVNDDGQKYFTSFVSGPNLLFVVTLIDSSHIALSCPELFSNQRCGFFIYHPIFKEVIYPLDRKFVPYFMDKENPNGTGSFSINRKPNSIIGTYSSAIGEGVTAYHRATNVIGRFNDYPADYYTEDAVGEVYNETHSEGIHYPYSKSYTFNSETGKYTLVEPMSTSLREIPTGNYVVLNGTRDINRDPNAQGSSIVLIQSSGRYSTNVQRIQGIKYTAIPHVHSVDSTGRYVHIVGNGNKQFPSNAHTLDWDGNAWFAGDVFVGRAGQDDGEVLAKMSEVIPIPTTAAVGQTIAVKALDENGKPTEWEAVDVGIDGYATEEWVGQNYQPKGDYLTQANLQTATNNALAQAKSSGEFDGENGLPGAAGKDGVSATHSWNGTTLTVTSASGTSSANLKGEKGDKGDKGDTGANGTSVTVSNVTTSTADGGSNVVTFSDGKTLTVKNGSKGSTGSAGKDGIDGKDGKDYVLTASDKTEIAEMVEGATIVQAPKYVNSVDEMTNTDRPYVLISTGHIWANAETTVETEGTVTDNIIATTDNPYVDGSRLGSSGDAMNNDAGGYHITPLIDLTKAEYQGKRIQIHLEGAQYASTGAYATYIQCRAYGTNKEVLMQRPYTVDVNIGGSGLIDVTNGTISVEYKSATSAVITIDVPPTYGSGKAAIGYLRFCGKGAIANSKIYITYTDTITTTGVQWFDTGTSYAPTLTAEDKAEIAEDVAEMIDTQLLSIIGDGSVTL